MEIERLWWRLLEQSRVDGGLLEEALRHLATAARLAPQQTARHLHPERLAAAGGDGGGRVDASAELGCAERRGRMGQALRTAAARAGLPLEGHT